MESGSAGQLFHSGMFLCPRSRRVPPALSSPGVNSGADQGSWGPPSNWVRVPARVPFPAWASGPPACVDRAPLKGEGPRGLTSVRCNGLHCSEEFRSFVTWPQAPSLHLCLHRQRQAHRTYMSVSFLTVHLPSSVGAFQDSRCPWRPFLPPISFPRKGSPAGWGLFLASALPSIPSCP